jgi:hypothetical protein
LAAIFAGAAAMLIVATDALYHRYLLHYWITALGIIALLLGLVSIWLGLFGVLHGSLKRDWLCNRVITERLRQFHFQAFCCRWPQIVRSLRSEADAREYTAQRRAWFDPVKGQLTLHAGAELTELLEDESEAKCWLHPVTPALPTQEGGDLAGQLTSRVELQIQSSLPAERANEGSTELSAVYRELRIQSEPIPEALDPVFAAYRELRIIHQLHYANYKLHHDFSIFSWPLRTQQVRFSGFLLLCTLVFFALHFWMAGGLVRHQPWEKTFDVLVICIAILALAVRALQEGLQPEREIERYRNYRAAVRAIRDRFDQATSCAAKIEVMREMERLSFDEARTFLRSAHEAQFIL